MIEPVPAPKTMKEYAGLAIEHMAYDFDAKILSKERCLLRPQSEGRVRMFENTTQLARWYIPQDRSYLTRAQAAWAVWDAHKKAEAEIRAMMPSVSYSWEEG